MTAQHAPLKAPITSDCFSKRPEIASPDPSIVVQMAMAYHLMNCSDHTVLLHNMTIVVMANISPSLSLVYMAFV